jgi:hypothetical protein
MYFALAVGACNIMRWVLCAVVCLAGAQAPRRSEIDNVPVQGAREI